MNKLFLLVLSLFIFASSCGDKCDDVTCLNNGICDEGICECPIGFEGGLCETLISEKLAGSYSVFSGCGDGSMPPEEWSVFSSTANNQFNINNFHLPSVNIVATLVGPATFEIEAQSVTIQGIEYTFFGEGNINRAGEIGVNYQVATSGTDGTIACIASATKG